MRYLKTFDRIWYCDNPERKIEVGDVVKIYPDYGWYSDDFNEFTINHIGLVTYISKKTGDYYIKFIPNEGENARTVSFNDRTFELHQISVSAKNREELELIMLGKKYNL